MSATEKIELFNGLFYLSLAIAVIGLVLAVFFFFFFNIRDVHMLMTGKAKRKTIERMEEQNARTGHLRSVSSDLKHVGSSQAQNVSVLAQEETAYLDPGNETTILQQPVETSVLNARRMNAPGGSDVPETSLLSARAKTRFDITEDTVVVHTTETI